MSDIHFCRVCYSSYGVELHHIIFRSKVPSLTDCKLNHVYLCSRHHRGENGVHGKYGDKLDKELKKEFQNKLELVFNKEYLTRKDIKEGLEISDRAADRLCKTFKQDKGMFNREDVILRCMGR